MDGWMAKETEDLLLNLLRLSLSKWHSAYQIQIILRQFSDFILFFERTQQKSIAGPGKKTKPGPLSGRFFVFPLWRDHQSHCLTVKDLLLGSTALEPSPKTAGSSLATAYLAAS